MANEDFLKQFYSHLEQSLQGAQTVGDELKQVIKTALNETFTKLELVSKEEFDVQKIVLARSREKIDQLEKKIKALEQLVSKSSSDQ
ncbi:accessory factor UbiK family protein [Porticoccaceae bacterium]|nr:accessory factor UbiK family protein [Porticoccaceae bacterium]MDA8652096.1 accessory factor UbiK family protein [Porticoccaceae bacterium]MDA8663820.1 accessory factor UbiK family protein [Porticoccaceae bacterium]MDA8681692.1 accessory factor UbiK family protein [Porticoccaceae bacterium]MDB2634984.1 accessory factor UbiK family protein [Porticoccaceae bacterium]